MSTDTPIEAMQFIADLPKSPIVKKFSLKFTQPQGFWAEMKIDGIEFLTEEHDDLPSVVEDIKKLILQRLAVREQELQNHLIELNRLIKKANL